MALHLQHPRSIKQSTVIQASPAKRLLVTVVFAVLYVAAFWFVYSTLGQPREDAIREAALLEEMKWAADHGDKVDVRAARRLATNELTGWRDLDDEDLDNDTNDVDDTDNVSNPATGDAADDNEPGNADDAVSSGSDYESPETGDEVRSAGSNADPEAAKLKKQRVLAAKSSTMSAAESIAAAARARDMELNTGEDEAVDTAPARPLPSPWLPNAFAAAALFGVVTLTCLFVLLCRWLVWFKAAALYSPAAAIVDGCYILMLPEAHRGRGAIARIHLVPGSSRLSFTFQRQQYEILTPAEVSSLATAAAEEAATAAKAAGISPGVASNASSADDATALVGLGASNGAVRPVPCPVDHPVASYVESRGLDSGAVGRQTDKYGRNVLSIQMPQFLQLYKEQLLSPIAMFQVFCAALWLMDEYWQYTGFTLFSLFALESTTTFQRLKTLKTLHNMCTKPYPINVYRNKSWRVVSTEDLLPGDLISVYWHPKRRSQANSDASVAAGASGAGADPSGANAKAANAAAAAMRTADVVPCDCVVLRGSAVVNEATLTGESVPQMKDSLRVDPSEAARARPLDMEGQDRIHVLFSGTTLINALADPADATASSASAASRKARRGAGAGAGAGAGGPTQAGALPETPDGGCLCYVLRTGFSSSQGSLVQLIEFSTQKVSGDSMETLLALFILLIFAIIAAAYVLKRGLEKGDRTTHELLLKCVIILTSVVPQHLPMQMAMAVNTALLSLNRAGIFCTEPFRVPIAGKVSHCLFDKTGTLTTDQLVPVGVVCGASRVGVDSAGVSAGAGAGAASGSGGKVSASASRLGEPVQLHGLVKKPELNGRVGVITSAVDPTTGRITVRLDPTADEPSVLGRFRPESLRELTSVARETIPVRDATPEAAVVLAGCHALVSVEGAGMVGDPIEIAGLKGVGWRYDAKTQTSKPGDWEAAEKAAAALKADMAAAKPGTPQHTTLSQRLVAQERLVEEAKALGKKSSVRAVCIKQRHHFSSKLQRMSVVCEIDSSASSALPSGTYCLVKGSPEAVASLLAPSAKPSWFDATYRRLAEHGMRVLGLAYKRCSTNDLEGVPTPEGGVAGELPRSFVESNLQFAGFVAFECKTRADSAIVVRALRESNHQVSMVTGDASLTALHVAGLVGIRDHASGSQDSFSRQALVLTVQPDGAGVEWQPAYSGPDGSLGPSLPFVASSLRSLAETHDLVTTETALDVAAAVSKGEVWKYVDVITVFARMSPQGKARVIREMQKHRQAQVLMCGDGGNDVGALKQAEVGLALLSGYGNMNTTEGAEALADPAGAGASTGAGGGGGGSSVSASASASASVAAEDALNMQTKVLSKRKADAAKHIRTILAAKRKEFTEKMKTEWLQEEMLAREARGESTGVMGNFAALKAVMARMQREMAKENARLQRLHGNVFDGGEKGAMAAAEAAADAAGEGDVPMVRPGDASIAAPFTSRSPSIRSVVDLIRQGRCTLLSALQQQQIMMLECMISAYTLSALSLEGARSSERQMMASSWLIMTASLAFSYSKPVEKMHPIRPLRSLFHPAVIISTLGQAAIHLTCMVYAVKMAEAAMGPEKLQEVIDFNRRVAAGESAQIRAEEAAALDEDPNPFAEFYALWSTPFKPNLMNTVVFLVETSQIMAVLFVNYKGRPWMTSILQNHALFLSIFICVAAIAACAWGVFPELNSLIHLEPFPNDEFRWQVMALVGCSLVGTFIWDRIATAIFSPRIFKAMLSEAAGTRPSDLMPVFMTAGKVALGFILLGTGNILLIGGLGYWWYRRRQQNAA